MNLYDLSKFWSGWLACGAVTSLGQDYVGKEAYIKLVEAGWIDPVYTVPLALFLLLIAYQMFAKSFPKEK